ncbi:MAG TPA: aminopeptidase P family N-terminal domain-containing protein [Haliscomenobacter sp.]|nr:aminopeptidase P family N-terminal domain-containing protein [Haliscomenobacter sp.]
MTIQHTSVELPDFGMPSAEPILSPAIYERRIEKLRQKMQAQALDVVIVYGDREHNANTTYLCGYDPRFEESLLIVGKTGLPHLLLGNEGWGYAELAPLPVERVLFQSLSLMGQDRLSGVSLNDALAAAGINSGSNIGVAGWKYFTTAEFPEPEYAFETPSYLIDALRKISGNPRQVRNANAIFMNPEDGLRILNEAEQLAMFEYAACHTSSGLKNVLFKMRPGMTEMEATTLMQLNGFPLGAHTMLSNGPRAAYGLPSPSMNTLKVGEPFTMCMCLWGGLNARAGWLVHDETELPEGVKDYLQKLAIPYFRAIVKWYEHIGIGVPAGELYELIHGEIGDPFFGVKLNPGHYIHIDEWVHSPVFKGSKLQFKSGMALQVDVIPGTGTAYHTSNIEDGIALADEALRSEIAQKFPEMWQRIQARRKFMAEVIGIKLKPEVLPFSNIPAYLPPYLLSPKNVLQVKQ